MKPPRAPRGSGALALDPALLDVSDLLARIDELEAAVSAALHVNKHLNIEVERYIKCLETAECERNAWQKRAKWLGKELVKARKEALPPASEETALADLLEQAALRAESPELQPEASTSAGSLQLSEQQERALRALKAKGLASGWLIDPSEISLGPVLGEGMFGITHKGTWKGAQVAVKRARLAKETDITNLLREVEALSAIRHPHVLPFLGACLVGPDHFWIITEFMEGGTLAAWLHPHRYTQRSPQATAGVGGPGGASGGGAGGPHGGEAAGGGGPGGHGPACLPSRSNFLDRLRLAYEVAQGMQALEGLYPAPLIHRDLKPSNVFIDGAGHARVADLGLSRRLLPGVGPDLTGETGTYLYMSPEVMRHEVYDTKADVWSWGVLLLECLTLQAPYAQTFHTPVQVAVGVADEALSPDIPSWIPVDLQVVAKLATSFDPEERPPFSLINAELAPIYDKLRAQQASQSASTGILGTISRGLTSTWGSLLGRIYPAVAGAGGAGAGGEAGDGGQGGASKPSKRSGLATFSAGPHLLKALLPGGGGGEA